MLACNKTRVLYTALPSFPERAKLLEVFSCPSFEVHKRLLCYAKLSFGVQLAMELAFGANESKKLIAAGVPNDS